MNNGGEAFPLTWPQGRRRTEHRQVSKFKVQSFDRSRERLLRQLRSLGAQRLILSTNIPLRPDGQPYARFASPQDPGVAVYFTLRERATCMACDRYRKVEDNLHALELTVEALRGIERWGSSDMMHQAFMGFTALPAPAPEPEEPWHLVLGVSEGATLAEAREARGLLARKHHPDIGTEPDHDKMVKVNRAWTQAQEARA